MDLHMIPSALCFFWCVTRQPSAAGLHDLASRGRKTPSELSLSLPDSLRLLDCTT